MKPSVINMNTVSAEHMSYAYLEKMRKTNPAWKLLTASLSPYITSFLFQVFIAEDRRQISGQELISRLDDFIYEVNNGQDTLMSSLVHPREVFALAIEDRAASIIIAHNHPSGMLDISEQDREVTRRIRQAGDIIGIRLDDHIIIAGEDFVSAY